MHDLLSGLSQLAQQHLADGTDSATIKVALITGMSLLGATSITAVATTFQRNRQPEPAPPSAPAESLSTELRRRAESAESQLADARARIDVLEAMCWDNHINPHTGAATG